MADGDTFSGKSLQGDALKNVKDVKNSDKGGVPLAGPESPGNLRMEGVKPDGVEKVSALNNGDGVFDLFGEYIGVNAGEIFRIWGGGDGYRVGVGECGQAASGFQFGFDEETGRNNDGVQNGDAFKQLFGEDDGDRLFGGGEIQRGELGLGAGFVFQGLFSQGNGENRTEEIQDPKEDLNVCGGAIESLFGENVCGNRLNHIAPKGNLERYLENAGQFNGGKDHSKGQVKGKRGRPKGSKTKKKIINAEQAINGLSEVAGDSKVANEIVQPKKKQGRPKGSKNKKRKIDTAEQTIEEPSEVTGDSKVQSKIVQPKKKQGRPKGSKNKKRKIDTAEQTIEEPSQVTGDIKVGNETVQPKKKQGRPKGSKNKKRKIDTVEQTIEEPSQVTYDSNVGNETVQPKRKQGRPKGSKNKKRKIDPAEQAIEQPSEVTGDSKVGKEAVQPKKKQGPPQGDSKVGNEIVQPKKKKGRPRGSKNKKRRIDIAKQTIEEPSEVACGSKVANEIVPPKKKRGRPKGSMSKKKHLAEQEIKGILSRTPSSNGVFEETLLLSLDNQVNNVSGEEVKGMPCETTGGSQAISENAQPKERRGRPKGSKKKKNNADNSGEMPSKIVDSDKSRNETVLPMDMEKCSNHTSDALIGEAEDLKKNRNTRGRKKKFRNQCENSESLDDTSRKKAGRSLRCHQCQRNNRTGVVNCSRCKRKRYCYECIANWYSEKTREDIEVACPFCQGNCNCRLCLKENLVNMVGHKEADANTKLQRLLYLLYKILPLLRHIRQEQYSELDVETNICGVQLTEQDVSVSLLDNDDRVYCDNCNTSIVNFHRSCPNPECSYDLCLACCHEIRKGFQPGVIESESSHRHFVERPSGQATDLNGRTPENCVEDDKEICLSSECVSDISLKIFDWRAEADGRIFCPPKEKGGCGAETLALRRIFGANWVHQLIESAEELTINYHLADNEFSQGCSLCDSGGSAGTVKDFEVRRAAYRDSSHDNFLYCPDAMQLQHDDIEHFQMHWMRGEPVIVRNVPGKTSGLSWEPMVMWRAFLGAKKVLKDEAQRVKAIDCLEW